MEGIILCAGVLVWLLRVLLSRNGEVLKVICASDEKTVTRPCFTEVSTRTSLSWSTLSKYVTLENILQV